MIWDPQIPRYPKMERQKRFRYPKISQDSEKKKLPQKSSQKHTDLEDLVLKGLEVVATLKESAADVLEEADDG